MKLHIENLEQKFEIINKLKKDNIYLSEKIKKMEDSKKENEIYILKKENKNIKELIGKKEKEFSYREKDLIEKINTLNKKILQYEESGKYMTTRYMIDSEIDKSVNKKLDYFFHKFFLNKFLYCFFIFNF